MLKSLFTLDYELHGNGEGSPYELMVEPTKRLLDLFDRYDAKLTIMADVAEILKFREYRETHAKDIFHYGAIEDQLREAIQRGHDVQMHIHSSYYNAEYLDGRWLQDWNDYNLAGLDRGRLTSFVRQGKEFLEELLKPIRHDFSCIAFRAANWSVSPSENVVSALADNSIPIDTSVFKYGRRTGLVNFDYTDAHNDLVPWPVSSADICKQDPQGRVLEFPIYSENRWVGAFISPNRFFRVFQARRHRFPQVSAALKSESKQGNKDLLAALGKGAKFFFGRHPWKADFNQCTSRQLVSALLRAERKYRERVEALPFVLIGHSKLFTRQNERGLEPFLAFVAKRNERFGFGCFRDFDLRLFRNAKAQSGMN